MIFSLWNAAVHLSLTVDILSVVCVCSILDREQKVGVDVDRLTDW